MKNLCLVFAPLGNSFLSIWNEGEEPKTFSFKVAEKVKVSRNQWKEGLLPVSITAPDEVVVDGVPLFELFESGDRLWTELGGKNGPFCLQVLERFAGEVEIRRIPTFRLVAESDEWNMESEEDELGGESFEQKAEKSRRARIANLVEHAKGHPEDFYSAISVDPPIWRIQSYINSYVYLQRRMRVPAQLRLYDMRFQFGWVPDEMVTPQLEKIRTLLSQPADIRYYLELEESLLAGIEKELNCLPIWEEFLKPIPGIAASVAGRLIGAIGDIRRFPSRDSFRAYCGWSVTRDGKAPRMRRKTAETNGQDEPKFEPRMKQAIFLFTDQIVRQGEANLYNALYYLSKERYRCEHPELSKIHIDKRARRRAAAKFINDFWAAWWRILEREGVELPQSVRDVLYPRVPET